MFGKSPPSPIWENFKNRLLSHRYPLLSNATVGAPIRNVGPSESMIRLTGPLADSHEIKGFL